MIKKSIIDLSTAKKKLYLELEQEYLNSNILVPSEYFLQIHNLAIEKILYHRYTSYIWYRLHYPKIFGLLEEGEEAKSLFKIKSLKKIT